MFGFESIECKTEPAGDGDFGYYMISVEIQIYKGRISQVK